MFKTSFSLFSILLNLNIDNSILTIVPSEVVQYNCSSLKKMGKVENNKKDSTFLRTGWYYVVDSVNGIQQQLYKSKRIFHLDPRPILTVKEINSLKIYDSTFYGKKYYGIAMHLNEEGAKKMRLITANSEVKSVIIGFVLDNTLLVVSEVYDPILNSIIDINRGDFTIQEVESFKRRIDNDK